MSSEGQYSPSWAKVFLFNHAEADVIFTFWVSHMLLSSLCNLKDVTTFQDSVSPSVQKKRMDGSGKLGNTMLLFWEQQLLLFLSMPSV